MSYRTVLTSTRAVLTLPDDTLILTPATITICSRTRRITSITPAVLPRSSFPSDTTYIDHSPHILLPGIVDAHVHLNEPGRTEWEGFETGTRAAAVGGVTTVVDMPLNAIPPTTTMDGLRAKVAAAENKCWVDVAFYGGVVPGNQDELMPLVEAGVRGFKCFMIDSGVEEFPAVSPKDIEIAMAVLKNAPPTTLMFHAEMDCQARPAAGVSTAYASFLSSRPPSFETTAVSEIISLAHHAPDLQLHIVHLSATECIPMLREARGRGIKITTETCFHYLELKAEDIEDGDTRHKCCPPIRQDKNREELWAELARPDSCIQTVVSDHSPCTPELKILPERLRKAQVGLDTPPISSPSEQLADPMDVAGSSLVEPFVSLTPACPVTDTPSPRLGGLAAPLASPDSGIGISSPWPGVSAASLATPDSGVGISTPRLDKLASPLRPDSGLGLTMEAMPGLDIAAPDAATPGDFFAAWGGIASVGLGLPILHTATGPRGLDILDIVRLCSQATARQVGLSYRKGGLREGMDADICVFDDEEVWVLTQGEMRWKNKCSPWEGRTFRGKVKETWVGGRKVWDGREMVGGPLGQLILEKRVT